MTTTNKTVLAWLDEVKNLTNPDNVVWIDGSEDQANALRAEAVASGEMIKLNEEKLPGCYLHRTKPTTLRVLRTEHSSAPANRKTQVRPTTGATRKKCMKNFITSHATVIKAEQCISFPIRWVPSARRLQKSALK